MQALAAVTVVPGLWLFLSVEVLCAFLHDLIAPWNFESVSRETQELAFSSSGGAEGAALLLEDCFLQQLLKKLKKKGPDFKWECEWS